MYSSRGRYTTLGVALNPGDRYTDSAPADVSLPPLDGGPGVPLSQAVYQSLHQAIGEGRIPAGGRLIENDIARLLGVSRTPVREALRRMQSDGTLESTPHRGFVVVDLMDDAAVVFQVRERLEGLAAALAAKRITVAELTELDRIQTRIEGLAPGAEGEAVDEMARLNAAFHTRINEASGSARLRTLVEHLTPAYVSYQVVTFYRPDERARSVQGHRRILDALWARDHDLADQLVQDHLEMGKRIALQRLTARSDQPEGHR